MERVAEAWREVIANGIVEVVAEHNIVAVSRFLEDDAEADAVLVRLVQGVGEVEGCWQRAVGVAYIFLLAVYPYHIDTEAYRRSPALSHKHSQSNAHSQSSASYPR